MKKMSLVLASILATSNVAVAADSSSNFGGLRASILGDWSFLSVTQKGAIAADATTAVATQDRVGTACAVLTTTVNDGPAQQAVIAGAAAVPGVAGHGALEAADRAVSNTGLGRVALNLGYTKVMPNNMLIGASILGGWDFSKITGAKNAVDSSKGIAATHPALAGADLTAAQVDNAAANDVLRKVARSTTAGQLAEGEILAGSYGLGANVTLGYVIMPKLALRILGEASYFQKKLTTVKTAAITARKAVVASPNEPGMIPEFDALSVAAAAALPGGNVDRAPVAAVTTDTTAWSLGLAAGAAVDLAVSDRIILTLGAKYNLPTTLEFKKADNKDQVADVRKFDLSKSWNIFAEVAFRVTQD